MPWYLILKIEISNLVVCLTPEVNILGFVDPHFLNFNSFCPKWIITKVFIQKMFYLIVPLRATREQHSVQFNFGSDAQHRVRLSSVMQTAESGSVVWCRLQSQTQQCDADCRVWLSGVMQTAEFPKIIFFYLYSTVILIKIMCLLFL